MAREIGESDYASILELETKEYGLKDAIKPPYSGLCIGEPLEAYLLTEEREDGFS